MFGSQVLRAPLAIGLRTPRVYFRQEPPEDDARPQHEPLVLSVADALARLPVSKSMLYDLIRSNQLETIKIGRRRFIPTDALRELIERLRTGGSA